MTEFFQGWGMSYEWAWFVATIAGILLIAGLSSLSLPGLAPFVSEFMVLRKGRFSIEAEADLHGLTVPQAKLHLREFICESVEYRLGCVRVIHGKGLGSGPGGPVLKGKVQCWLAQWDEVLAFVTALARDGGSGAVYVLLQRRRSPRMSR